MVIRTKTPRVPSTLFTVSRFKLIDGDWSNTSFTSARAEVRVRGAKLTVARDTAIIYVYTTRNQQVLLSQAARNFVGLQKQTGLSSRGENEASLSSLLLPS